MTTEFVKGFLAGVRAEFPADTPTEVLEILARAFEQRPKPFVAEVVPLRRVA